MIQQNISLKNYSNYKIGGVAQFFGIARSIDELIELLTFAKEKKLPVHILGGGTNLLINDGLIQGLVVKPEMGFIKKSKNNILKIGAGVLMKDLLEFTIDNELSGLEWAGGLPGTLGGAIRGNSGAFEGEIKNSVVGVESLSYKGENYKIIQRACDLCQFSYRNSLFKALPTEIITSATLQFLPGHSGDIQEKIREKIDYRNLRHPLEFPNIGSIFKNVPLNLVSDDVQAKFKDKIKNDPLPILPTAVLIADAGLRGIQFGGAQISEKHTNFIINKNNATSQDIQALISLIKKTIKMKYAIELEEEIIHWT